jgi:hypothetical protein
MEEGSHHKDTKVWKPTKNEHAILSCQTFVSLCLCGDSNYLHPFADFFKSC